MPPLASRSGLTLTGLVVLLFLIGVVAFAWYANRDTKRQTRQTFIIDQSSPERMLPRLFVEMSRQRTLDETPWETILALMSADDRQWLEQNAQLLARLHHPMTGSAVPVLSPDEARFSALQLMLHLDAPRERPIVVRAQIDTSNTRAVAYSHPPNRIEELREIFLVNEAGQWRVQRFLGERDDPAFMTRLVAAKRAAGAALTSEEQAFAADPRAAASKKRMEMLAGVGLSPPPGSAPH